MTSPTNELQALINNLDVELTDFKRSAMLLARGGADLAVCGTTDSRDTLLHYLVRTNKNGVNDNEINELLTLKEDMINVNNGCGDTTLTSLINQLMTQQCTLGDFKHSAMLLARRGARLTTTGLLHCLVCTNKNGINDNEINELLTLQKDMIDAKNGYGDTALSSLINQLMTQQCTLEDFKRSAMLLARRGADLTVRGTTGSGDTLLHCLVLTNNKGVNDNEINELLTLQKDMLNVKNRPRCTALTSLIDQLMTQQCTLEDFKHSAMLLAHGGADLTVYGTTDSRDTLLHCLVLTNNKGVNDKEINELLTLKEDIINAKNLFGRTTLTSLINQLMNQQCTLEDFKHSAMLLARRGADLTVCATTSSGDTLLHCLVRTNKNGVNDNEIRELKILKSGIVNIPDDDDCQSIQDSPLLCKQPEIISPQDKLFATIDSLKKYGILLKRQGASKGQIAIDLADALKLKAETFFKKAATNDELTTFQHNFYELLNSKNHEMSKYRTSWSTIIANIAIALTGIGALLLVGRLIYTQATEGRPLFFFQKHQTTSEEKVNEVRQAIFSLDLN